MPFPILIYGNIAKWATLLKVRVPGHFEVKLFLQAYDTRQSNTSVSAMCVREMVREMVFNFNMFTHMNQLIWAICETLLQLPTTFSVRLFKVKDEMDLDTSYIACKQNLTKQVGFKSHK